VGKKKRMENKKKTGQYEGGEEEGENIKKVEVEEE
jgi:hypothetical protein